jgi:hypothetical protein
MERKITDEIISVLMSSEIDIAEIKKTSDFKKGRK